MADIFLKMDGIKGESQEFGHVGEIEILAWSWSIRADSAHSGGAGKATVHDMDLSHLVDCASPNFMRYATTGKIVEKAILTLRKPGGVPLPFLKFTMENVRISHVNPVGSGGVYIENIKLRFARIKQEYTVQNDKGGSGGVIAAAYDLRENREV